MSWPWVEAHSAGSRPGRSAAPASAAYWPVTSCIEPVTPHPINSQPIGCRGRRVAMTSPRVAYTAGIMVVSRQ
jgi:hypothetical protein